MEISKLFKTALVGVGQIFLQDNGWTGVLFTLGMFFSGWDLGVTCFLGSLVGTITAQVLKYKEEDISFGLYGFNGSLAFMCMMFLFGNSNPIIWLLGIVAAIISTLVMHQFVKRGKVAYTFPFVSTCWVIFYVATGTGILEQTTAPLPMYATEVNDFASTVINTLYTPFFGQAEVNFGASVITGVLIFLGLAICTPTAAVYSITAAVIGSIVAYHLGENPNVVVNGIYGFSPILVACAFAGPKRSDFIYVIVGTVMAVLIHFTMSKIGIIQYTFPFILTSWILLYVKAAIEKLNPDTSKLVRFLNP